MKPSSLSHIARAIFKDIGVIAKIDADGSCEALPFPSPGPRFAERYLAYNLLRKQESSANSTAVRNSLRKWTDAEELCGIVNRYGSLFCPVNSEEKKTLEYLLQRTRFHLSRLLCDVWPDFSDLSFTNGATSSLSRDFSLTVAKSDGTPLDSTLTTKQSYYCVSSAEDLLREALECNPGILARYIRAVEGQPTVFDVGLLPDDASNMARKLISDAPALLDFVEKDKDSVRLICKSGALSIALQSVFGKAIRQALLSENIDINDQTINQEWAEIGSLTGLVATVDLSSASDSISLACLDLFPPRWKEYFLATRDKCVSVKGSDRVHQLQMVAGMGNGFIFELETALFWALSLSATEHVGSNTSWVSVYGDDIIVPSAAYTTLEHLLRYCGFTLNANKSFTGNHPFRESCGKHYYSGEDVTPFYIKCSPSHPSQFVKICNDLASWCERRGVYHIRAYTVCLNHVPLSQRYWVPPTWDTSSGLHHLWCNTVKVPQRKWVKRYQAYTTYTYVYRRETYDILERLPLSQQVVLGILNAKGSSHDGLEASVPCSFPRETGRVVRKRVTVEYRQECP